MLTAGISAVILPSCSDTDLYETDSPDWLQTRIDSIAAAKEANAGGEEEAPGLVIDLNKYADDFVFNGDAEMVTSDVLLIETGAGGKNKNFVRLKEDGWLKDKITFTNVATISFDAYPTVNGSDWNYVFAIGNTKKSAAVTDGGAYAYFDGTIGFIQRVGDPYEGFFPGGCWADGNQLGGTADNNPYNYFSGLDESNCNKWWHFDYIYSTSELSIYVNGVKAITHPLSTEQGAAVKNILATLNEGQLIIGAGCEEGDLENFGGYIANFTLRNEEYVKTSNFFSGEITPKESEIKSLTVTGPETVPFGTTYEKLLEQVSIKVGYEIDGEPREKELSTSDVIINLIPDMSTIGKKTLSVYYNTTYAGKFQKNVKTDLVFEVTPLSVNALAIKSDLSSAYYFTGADPTKVFNGLEVDGVQSNGDAIKLDNSTLVFTKVDGNGNFNVSYTTSDGKNLSANGKFGGEKLDNVVSVSFDDCTIQGGGKFVDDATFGKVFENDNSAQRSSYLMLPAGTIQDCSKTGEMTISFWVNGNGKAFMWSPLFAAYAAAPVDNTNTFPMFIIQGRGLLQTNIEGYNDFTAEQNVAGANTESIAYLEDNQWHLVTVTITDKHAEFIVDNTVVNAWNYTGEGNGNVTAGFLTKGHEMLTYICLGGNQAWNWGDPDTGYKYAKLKTYNRVISAEEIAKRIKDKE